MKYRHNDYSDIIALPHYELRFHPRMPMEARAAQFAAFAALTGYEKAIDQTTQRVQQAETARHDDEDYDAAWDDWDDAGETPD